MIEKIDTKNFFGTWLTAHAGCDETKKDSIESIEKAIEWQKEIDILEIDIRSFGGTLIYAHDKVFTKKIAKTKPTIKEVFEKIAKSSLMINCDLKERGRIKEVLELSDKAGISRDRIMFTGSVTKKEIKTIKDIDFMVFVNFGFFGIKINNKPKSFEKIKSELNSYLGRFLKHGLNINYRKLTDKLYNFIKENDIKISVWTVNNEKNIEDLLRLKVDNITTKNLIGATKLKQKFSYTHNEQ